MTTFDFGVLTSIFTFGGLIASLNAGRLADERGRKGTALVAAWLVIIVSLVRELERED
jgi:MFS family permease